MKSKILKLEPNLEIPNAENELPARERDLIENAEPNHTLSRTETAEPKHAIPYTDITLPILE
jgi:hypothetical protein